jgi:hypothetical protein
VVAFDGGGEDVRKEVVLPSANHLEAHQDRKIQHR